ncbi:hypothetical protein ACFLUF_03060, partial [Chloroflexota bacterium]
MTTNGSLPGAPIFWTSSDMFSAFLAVKMPLEWEYKPGFPVSHRPVICASVYGITPQMLPEELK